MATKYWYGGAIKVAEVYTISITGAWATADTCYVQINNKRLTLTVGAAATIDNVGAALEAMINSDDAVGTETRSALGTDVGEFADLTAAYDAANDNLTITGTDDGRPIGTLTVGETTTGNGALAVDNGGDPTTAGAGPNHWAATANWSGGTVPVANDDVVFDHQATSSCLYNLSNAALVLDSVKVTKGFRYSIGLPEANTDNSSMPYKEHLTTFLTLSAATEIDIDGSGGGSIKISAGIADTTAVVRGSGSQAENGVPAVLLNINNAGADLQVIDGDVGVCFVSGTAGQLDTFVCGGNGSPRLTLGDTITLSGCDGRVKSGKVVCQTNIDNIYVDGGEWEQLAGTATAVHVSNGVFWDMSTGTFTTVNMTGGRYDHSHGLAKTVTNFNIYARCQVKDASGTLTATNGFDIYPPLQDVTLEFPTRKTYTLSAI